MEVSDHTLKPVDYFEQSTMTLEMSDHTNMFGYLSTVAVHLTTLKCLLF